MQRRCVLASSPTPIRISERPAQWHCRNASGQHPNWMISCIARTSKFGNLALFIAGHDASRVVALAPRSAHLGDQAPAASSEAISDY
eukprot:5960798-Pyramimonas_sp.AAC.1